MEMSCHNAPFMRSKYSRSPYCPTGPVRMFSRALFRLITVSFSALPAKRTPVLCQFSETFTLNID